MLVVKGYPIHDSLFEIVCMKNRCLGDGGCRGFCCAGGAFCYADEMQRVFDHDEQIAPLMRPLEWGPNGWFMFPPDVDVDRETPHHRKLAGETSLEPHPFFSEKSLSPEDALRVLNTTPAYRGWACVFLTLDGRCVLHHYGQSVLGIPYGIKPFWCALYPLVYDEIQKAICMDNRAYQTCLEPSPEPRPLHALVRSELVYLLGEDGYKELEAYGAS